MATQAFYTSKGEEFVIDLITGDAAAPSDYYVGWGNGGDQGHSKASTTLRAALPEARVAATETQPTADKAQWVATLTAGAVRAVDEVGLFNAVADGDLIIVASHDEVNLAQGERIEYTITHEQA